MEENNKKGFNTLYLVLGVSTLVVAIIGATFAFFSASQTDDTIQGSISEAGGLVLDVKSVTYDPTATRTGNNIIPLNLIVNQKLKEGKTDEYVDSESQFALAMANGCRDSLGNNVCEVYKITVKNQSATATVQIRGKLKLTSEASNMYWQLIKATSSDKLFTYNETVTGEDGQTSTVERTVTQEALTGAYEIKTATGESIAVGKDEDGNYIEGALTLAVTDTALPDAEEPNYVAGVDTNVSLAGNAEAVFYVVVWLEEVGESQEKVDASGPYGAPAEDDETETPTNIVRRYKGEITFDAVDANGIKSGVTATFINQ